jgi:hypothetical protein
MHVGKLQWSFDTGLGRDSRFDDMIDLEVLEMVRRKITFVVFHNNSGAKG